MKVFHFVADCVEEVLVDFILNLKEELEGDFRVRNMTLKNL